MWSLIRSHLPRGWQPQGDGPQGIRVYYYHGLVRTRQDDRLERNFHRLSDFRAHVQFFRRQGIMSLDQLTHALAQHDGLDRPAAVITFDDGYANNLLAAEILSEAKIPWTLFVSTGAVGRSKTIWTVGLSLLLLHGRCEALEALGQVWPLKTRKEREEAFQTIRCHLKAMPASLRLPVTNAIQAQFPAAETERLLEQFPAFHMLTWKEIGQLAEAGVEIGSHGVDHEIHHTAQDPEVRHHELAESKREIERELGKRCRCFAFPNGDHCEHSAQEVERAGYGLALTTQQSSIRPVSNRFLLPRVSPGGSLAKLKQRSRGCRL